MAWLITHTLEALNLVHVMQIYADKSKVKAQSSSGFPVDVAIDVTPEVARRIVRDVIDQVAEGHSVEVVGEEVRPISTLRSTRQPARRQAQLSRALSPSKGQLQRVCA